MRNATLIRDRERIPVAIHGSSFDVKEGEPITHLRQRMTGDRQFLRCGHGLPHRCQCHKAASITACTTDAVGQYFSEYFRISYLEHACEPRFCDAYWPSAPILILKENIGPPLGDAGALQGAPTRAFLITDIIFWSRREREAALALLPVQPVKLVSR